MERSLGRSLNLRSKNSRSLIRLAAALLSMWIASLASSGTLKAANVNVTPPEPPPPNLSSSASVTAQQSDVAVVEPPPPPPQDLTSDSLFQFVVHHGSTHYSAATGDIGGSLYRWRGGRSETICPATVGLGRSYNDFVTARIRAVASFVGAPVQSSVPCKPNVEIIFTPEPRSAMEAVLKWAAHYVGVGFPHQEQRELQISGAHAIQGWYVTASGGSSVLNRDAGLVGGIAIQSLWPRIVPTSGHPIGANRSILSVVLVIDTNKAAVMPMASIADYAALAALTVIATPDHCDPLPSILDVTSPSCASRDKPTGITAADLAFLKALYYHNTGLGPTLSRDDMVLNMTRQFRGG